MRISGELRPQAIYDELIRRMKEYRLSSRMTQDELSQKAMVSKSTIHRLERGGDISLMTFLRLMHALELQGKLELLIPDPDERPSNYLPERKGKKRVRHKKKEEKNVWKWGDEE